ncbi:MAG: metallophosphoesterase [Bacteroidales bacterium]
MKATKFSRFSISGRNAAGIGKILRTISLILIMIFITSSYRDNSFMLVLLPDTQSYSSNFPDIFNSQTSWIAEKADEITFVLHQGDITNDNIEKEWIVATDALEKMDGKVPYTFVPGNHDMGENGKAETRNTDLFNQFLPFNKYSSLRTFGGAFETGKMDNTYHTFRAGGRKWLILSLEFGPRNSVLEWAGSVIEDHPRHKVIINTHAYMYSDETRMSAERDHKWLPQNYGLGKASGADSVNDGEAMWEKLLGKYKNVMLVFSGHVLNDGAGTLVSTGINGNKVYQMLANYQGGVIGSENGGNGFLRMVTINPKANSISVRSYSPSLDQFKTDEEHEFTFEDVEFLRR